MPRIFGGSMQVNPAWVGNALAQSYEVLEAKVKPEWLPKLASVKRAARGYISGKPEEYGCGVYGCVIPTLDPKVVLKLTTDDTEAEFAATLSETLVRPICVSYFLVLQLAYKHQGHTVYLLWRDSAEDVGKFGEVEGDAAVDLLHVQHAAAQDAYKAVMLGYEPAKMRAVLNVWVESCEKMARQTKVPALRPLGDGLVEIWGQQRILFGDIHAGNLGRVGSQWLVTDPGNIAVIDTEVDNPGRPQDPSARLIEDAARKVAVGRGRHKALIADVWVQICREHGDDEMSYADFQQELSRLFKRHRIVLGRCDLPQLFGANKVAASKVSIGKDTFHFVVV